MPQTNNNATLVFYERLYLYSLLFFAVLLPFQFAWLPLTLGLMLYSLTWLISHRFGTKFRRLFKNTPALASLAYLTWVAIGTLYSDFPDNAMRILTLKVPFGAWAILLATSGLGGREVVGKVLRAFIYAIAIASVITLIQPGILFLSGTSLADVTTFHLLRFFNVPPHYFGLYLNFAYGVLLGWLLRKEYLLNKRWLSLLVLSLFILTIILLSVRMQYIVFLVVNLVVVTMAVRSSGSLQIIRFAWIPVLILLGGMLIFPIPRGRIIDTFHELVSFKEMVNNKQTNPRKFLWRDGLKVIAENPLAGTGTGGADAALHARLESEKAVFWDGQKTFTLAETSYNYHNSYLQHWAANGVIGLCLLLFLFAYPPWKYRLGVEEVVFLIACALSFITESMLQRQAGVLFFSFFYGLLFFLPQSKPERSKKKAS